MRRSTRVAGGAASSKSSELPEGGDPRRAWLLGLLETGLRAVEGRRCVRAALAAAAAPDALAAPDAPAAATAPVWVAAVGKAAESMALGAHDALGGAIERALLITRDAPLSPDLARLGAEVLVSAHPLPDERSLAAGERLLAWVESLPSTVEPLFLISGGASSLVEVPEPGVTLHDLEALTHQAFAEGLAIGELNRRRAALSRIKGGRLAARLRGRPARALFISDVPDDSPSVIGSGLMGPAADGDDRIRRQVVASVDHAVAAVAAAAAGLGLSVHPPGRRFGGDAVRLAARFAHELHMGAAQLHVWGGESTVALPPHPGRGGRNQHLALAAARLIAGRAELMLLAAGTDGSDGVTEDAGALVDAESCARIALAELEAERCLESADSARALAASGDLVHTGPTGTNVGDLVIGLKLAADSARALDALHSGTRPRVL
jgi:glycerate 2-kinase